MPAEAPTCQHRGRGFGGVRAYQGTVQVFHVLDLATKLWQPCRTTQGQRAGWL